jgi:hypothetical protein
VSDEYNPMELAHEKRMRGKFSPIDAFEVVRNNREWYCPRCQAFVSSKAVTYEETHVVCGTTVTADDVVVTLAQENARLTAELARLSRRDVDLAEAETALDVCGIGGIYADFTGVADAIRQMGQHIGEQKAEMDAIKRRTCATCKHWQPTLYSRHTGEPGVGTCAYWEDAEPPLLTTPADFCSHHEDKGRDPAAAIFEACQRATRTCGTCRNHDERGWCEVNGRSTRDCGFCNEHETKEAPDAD